MSPTLTLTLEDEGLRKLLDLLEDKLGGDVRPIFREFAQYMRTQTDNTFSALRHGGTFRGVTWDYFAPQYKRKSDGVTVPAWGGVPKVRGSGKVKPRIRPSGQPVRKGDSIVQDNETLRGRAALVLQMKPQLLELGPRGLNYAAAQQSMRPFLFFTNKDANELVQIAIRRLQKAFGLGL